MAESYAAVLDGTTMDGQDVQQVIDGITGARMVAHSMFNDEVANAALTLKNTSTADGAPSVKIQNAGATLDVLKVYHSASNGEVAQFGDGVRVGVGAGVNDLGLFFVNHVGGEVSGTYVMSDFSYEPVGNANPSDVSAIRASVINRTGGNNTMMRALESHLVSYSPTKTNTFPVMGIEISSQSVVAGNGDDRFLGMQIKNLPRAWFEPAQGVGSKGDTAIFVGADDAGWTNYIRFKGNTNAGTANQIMFNVNEAGACSAYGFFPLADSTSDLGTSSVAFRATYTDKLLLTDLGLVGTPALAFSGDPNTGLFQPSASADNLSIVCGGTEMIRVTNFGLLDFRNSQPFAVAGGAAATLAGITNGPGATAQSHWLQIKHNGTTRFIPCWT